MRGACAGFLILILASPALAQPHKSGEVPIDPKALSFFGDGHGHYVAVKMDDGTLFYARHNEPFYQQIMGHSSSSDGEHKEWSFWSPQARGPGDVHDWNAWSNIDGALTVYLKSHDADVRCSDRHTKLMRVDAKTAAKLRRKAFKPSKNDRRILFFARDDNANYYLADARLQSRGGGDVRFFYGKLGGVKELRLTELINDPVGDVLIGPGGRFVYNRLKKEMSWHPRGGESVEVFSLDLERNDYVIYGSLGVYKDRLGTPCDDL